MSAAETKERILDAAERLFAERGFAATSTRGITRVADVNLAAVNYHFGSKEQLLCEVVVRRIDPVNRARVRLLDECEAALPDAEPSLEQVLHAFIHPVFALTNGPFQRLIGRLYAEPVEALVELYKRQFGDVFDRFRTALSRALPELPKAEVYWRLEFIIGVLVHALMAGDRLQLVTDGVCDLTNVDEIAERMVAFAAGGLRAPVDPQLTPRPVCSAM